MASNRPGLDFFDELLGSTREQTKPTGLVAQRCLRRAAAGLAADVDGDRRALGNALDGATVNTGAMGERAIVASVAVQSSNLALLRQHMATLRAELEGQFAHEGWRMTELRLVASEPAAVPQQVRAGPPKKSEVASALAEAIASLKSYVVADMCDQLGMPAHPDSDADPFRSKRMYVQARLQTLDVEHIASTARRYLEEYDDEALEVILDRLRRGGHEGTVKNLIFGSTRKPDLVLEDALSNDIGLVNSDEALLYDDGIPADGLSWRAIVSALMPKEAARDLREASLALYRRLKLCLASDAERNLFLAYAERYGDVGFDEPALIPQVWLHYDPKSAWQRDGKAPLVRQRMDFLLLLAGRRRVVLEVDGIEHYSHNGRPSPGRYAEMVCADRELRLAGYEVYRFGGAELMDIENARALIGGFMDQLLKAR